MGWRKEFKVTCIGNTMTGRGESSVSAGVGGTNREAY